MTENKEHAQSQKDWATPELTVYGNVDHLTLVPKLKDYGTSDDFGIAGISDA